MFIDNRIIIHQIRYYCYCKDLDDGGYEISFNKTASELKNIGNIRMCCKTENIGPCPKVYYGKINGEGEYVKDYSQSPIYLKDGCLKESVYVDAQNVIGLTEAVNKLATEISRSE